MPRDNLVVKGGINMLRKVSIGIVVVIVSLGIGRVGLAQERIRLAWAGASPSNSPIWAMQERKFLEKQGVQPEIVSISASPTVLQALLAGEIDAASISVTTLTSSRLAGADSVMIVGVVPTFVDFIVSSPTITSVEQLKGKIGGVNRLGSTSDLGLRLALRKLGIDPEKDVKIIPTGGNPERFAALLKGLTQFTIMSEPFVREGESLGLKKLFAINSLNIPFWWNGILTREAIVKSRRPLMLKLTRAMIESIHYLKTDKEGAKALFRKNLGISNPEALERAYNAYIPIFNEAPYPTPDGVKTMLDDLARIAQVEQPDGEGNEQDEAALVEIIEYIRVASQLVHDELRLAGAPPASGRTH
jgi:ABC-type nitrate/sulfonate/bicarbonate transport system substrate-binding protein